MTLKENISYKNDPAVLWLLLYSLFRFLMSVIGLYGPSSRRESIY